jgi:hypothetical protein
LPFPLISQAAARDRANPSDAFCDADEKMVELSGTVDQLLSTVGKEKSPPLELQEVQAMRYLISIIAAVALSALAIVTTAGQAQSDGVRRITPAEARAAVMQGKAIIIDVRGEDSYNAGHIKGARWINLNDIGARAGELPRDKMIVTYCS